MSHYEQRLEHDLRKIRKRVRKIGARIEEALQQAVHALLVSNHEIAAQVILGDLSINREVRAIDRLCHAFVARHLPSAGHLRFVSSVLRLNVELERIGDYAVAIAREAQQVSTAPAAVLRDFDLMADQARLLLSQALRSFDEGNPDLARGTKAMAKQAESIVQKVFANLLEVGEARTLPLKDVFALLVVLNKLSRVSDQSKNICEETVFAATGETKEPKIYQILFIDESNDAYSQMAEAYSRKIFPESGHYSSAGWKPASSLVPACSSFLDHNGFATRDLEPTLLDLPIEELADFHVIVNLEADQEPPLPGIPFHTVLLNWNVGPSLSGNRTDTMATEVVKGTLEEAHKSISARVRDLIEQLRGEDAV